MDKLDIISNLKEIRIRKGMTQVDLAKLMGVTMNSIARWEQGANKPSEENMDKLKKVLEIE